MKITPTLHDILENWEFRENLYFLPDEQLARKGGENAKNFSLKALEPMLAKGQQFLETMEK